MPFEHGHTPHVSLTSTIRAPSYFACARDTVRSDAPWGTEGTHPEELREVLVERMETGLVQPYEFWLALLHAAGADASQRKLSHDAFGAALRGATNYDGPTATIQAIVVRVAVWTREVEAAGLSTASLSHTHSLTPRILTPPPPPPPLLLPSAYPLPRPLCLPLSPSLLPPSLTLIQEEIDDDGDAFINVDELLDWLGGVTGRRKRMRAMTMGKWRRPEEQPLGELSWSVATFHLELTAMLERADCSSFDLLTAYDRR